MVAPRKLPVDFVRIEELEELSGYDRSTLYLWVNSGLLPRPVPAKGRGNVSRWPLISRDLVKFIAQQREIGYDLATIRQRIALAFGEEILETLPKPQSRSRQ